MAANPLTNPYDNIYDQAGLFDQWFYADAKAHKNELKKIDRDDIPWAVSTQELDTGLKDPTISSRTKKTLSRIKSKFQFMKNYQKSIDGKDHSRDYFELPKRWWKKSQNVPGTKDQGAGNLSGLVKQVLEFMVSMLEVVGNLLQK